MNFTKYFDVLVIIIIRSVHSNEKEKNRTKLSLKQMCRKATMVDHRSIYFISKTIFFGKHFELQKWKHVLQPVS